MSKRERARGRSNGRLQAVFAAGGIDAVAGGFCAVLALGLGAVALDLAGAAGQAGPRDAGLAWSRGFLGRLSWTVKARDGEFASEGRGPTRLEEGHRVEFGL